jgi:hypothetical protein
VVLLEGLGWFRQRGPGACDTRERASAGSPRSFEGSGVVAQPNDQRQVPDEPVEPVVGEDEADGESLGEGEVEAVVEGAAGGVGGRGGGPHERVVIDRGQGEGEEFINRGVGLGAGDPGRAAPGGDGDRRGDFGADVRRRNQLDGAGGELVEQAEGAVGIGFVGQATEASTTSSSAVAAMRRIFLLPRLVD